MFSIPWISSFNIYYFMGIDGISFPLVMLTSFRQHAGDGGKLADHEEREGVLHPVSAAGNGHAGRVSGARFLPVLRVLGSDAAADVFSHRRVGRAAAGICGHQVFSLHALGQRADADRDLDALFQERSADAFARATRRPRRSSKRRPMPRRSKPPRRRSTRSTSWPCSKSARCRHSPFNDELLWGKSVGWWAFLLLFIGFAIKVPAVPLHTWLPDAHVEAPTPISMILAGVLLKMGGYGIIRICFPICPVGGYELAYFVCGIGVLSMVYGAFAAMAQKDFKRLVAYSSVSHMGYVVLGLGVWSANSGHVYDPDYWSMGVNGAMFQMIAHGISSAGMFFMVGVVYDRVHHRNLDQFGGLFAKMPVYSGLGDRHLLRRAGVAGLVRIHRRSVGDACRCGTTATRWRSFPRRW